MGRPGERMAWYLNSPPRDRAKKPESPAERSRRERWKFPIAARVVHPTRGTVVVPCRSKLAALMCAAEAWGCSWMDLDDAKVWRAEPGDQAVPMPTLYKRSAGNADQ